MKNITASMAIALAIWAFFLTACKESGRPTVQPTIIKETLTPCSVTLTKENSIDFDGLHYPSLFLDRAAATLNVYGYTARGSGAKLLIKTYSKDLAFVADKTLNVGQGPADVGSGVHFFSTSSALMAPDNTQRRINIFDHKFNFKKFVKLTGYLPVTFNENGSSFMGTVFNMDDNGHTSYTIELVSYPGMKKKKIHFIEPVPVFNKKNKLIIGAQPEFHYFFRNGNIYFLSMNDYTLIRFDSTGKVLKSVRIDAEKVRVANAVKEKWLKEQTQPSMLKKSVLFDVIQPASWMVPLQKGFVVIRRKGYGTSCDGLTEADYFDYNLGLKGKTQFPCFDRIFKLRRGYFVRVAEYLDGNLFLLNNADDLNTLEKWKVEE